MWHSLVVCLVRDQEAAGSSPATPTKKIRSALQDGFFLRRKAAAYGFICGLRLCERGYIENKTAGRCKFTGEKQKTPQRGVFYGITPRKT